MKAVYNVCCYFVYLLSLMNIFVVTTRKIKLRKFHYINNHKMCTSTILIKVAINSLEHLTMKPVFLRNSFGVLFHITETSQRLLRSTWIISISQFWPNIWIKNGSLLDVVLRLNGIDWKKYFCEYLRTTGY